MADASDLLFYDALNPEERRVLRARLAEQPELLEDLRHWQAVRAELRGRLEQRVPDRDLLVLYALEEDLGSDLVSGERARLEAARAGIEAALEAHPALHDVVRHIREERDDFEATWDEHFGTPSRRRAGERTAARRPDREPARPRRWKPILWRTSAVVAVVAFAAIVMLLVQRDAGMVVVEAPEGKVRVVELTDGSTVRLQGGARLTFSEGEAASIVPRRTRLDGRAFFEVVPGEGAFIVETPTGQATVLGTSFGVDAGKDVTEVVLATGSLALAPRGASARAVVLEPGQMSRVAAGAVPSTPVEVELDEALAWTELFLFERTPVSVIAERLADHYDVVIAVAPELRDERVTGTFEQKRGVEEILRVVAATLGAQVERDEDGYLLRL